MTYSCIPPLVLEVLAFAIPWRHGRTTHDIFIIVGAIFAGLTVLLGLLQILRHLIYHENPVQQRHLIRLAALPGVYALFGVFGVSFYAASPYLETVPRFYDSLVLCSLLELFMGYLGTSSAVSRTERVHYIRANDPKISRKTKICWLMVFQVPWVALCCLVATEVTSAKLCIIDESARHARTAIRVIGGVSAFTALIGLLIFYHHNRPQLRQFGAGWKLIGVKLIVIVVVVETIVFGALKSTAYHPSRHVSVFDLYIGLPNLIQCVEMFLFGLLWLGLFGRSAAHDTAATPEPRVGFFRALLGALNFLDCFTGFFVGLRACLTPGKAYDAQTKVEQEGYSS